VPTLVKFSGTLTDVKGTPLIGIVEVTFYLHKDQRAEHRCGWKPRMCSQTSTDAIRCGSVPRPARG
jgi:hypothetical protein